ncbi:MAG: membrane dipeptidase, partial [Acidobacteria bacterium]|nr:membrane dipeptidase [Acidobacteriota bacterium]
TFCQALHYHPRGKSDSLLRAMADKGGVAGICMVGYFLTPGPQATLEDYINHLTHAVKVCGIDHVGMSTDTPLRGRIATTDREVFMKSRNTDFKPNYNPRWAWAPELDRVDRYRTVAHALAQKGYKMADIEKLLGGNWLRYLREVFRG